MKKIFILASVLRKCGNESAEELGKKKFLNSDRIAALILTVGGSILFFWLGTILAPITALMPDPYILFKAFYLCAAIMIAFISIPVVLNQFYMSNDVSVLFTLPFKPFHIAAARLINASRAPYLISFVFTIPFGIGYALKAAVQPSFFAAEIIAFICIPLISFSFISVIVILIMSFVKGLRNKDHLKIIGVIIVFAALMLYYLFLGNHSEIDDKMVANAFNSIGRYTNILPINFALGSLLNGFSVPSLVLAIGITAVFVAVFWLAATTLYLNGAVSMLETSSSGKQLDSDAINKLAGKRSIVRSYMHVDFVSVKREPAYLMTGFLYSLILPAVLLYFNISQSDTAEMIAYIIKQPIGAVFIAMIFSVELTFIAAGINAIALSSLSREGKNLDFLKQIPVSFDDIIKAKRIIAVMICSIGSTLYIIIGGIIFAFAFGMPAWAILCGLAVNIPALFFIVNMNMTSDFKNPRFAWESEAIMLKKITRIGSYIMFILGIMLPSIFLNLLDILVRFPDFMLLCVFAAVVALFIILAFLSNKRLYKVGREAFLNL